MNETVGQMGEQHVLSRVLVKLSAADTASLGPGDDCAVLTEQPGTDTVVTTDTMIEGPDFRLAWHSGYELGWKLAATNLSDVAAMGAVPTALTLALAVPQHTPVALLEDIAEGANAACHTLAPGCGIVGGDLGTAPVIMAAVTALGVVGVGSAIRRSGAGTGDQIAYAGELGLAGLGLSLLFAQAAEPDGTAHSRTLSELWQTHAEVLSAQLAPTPPIPLGVAAAAAGATAMMDVSDGLSLDAARLARASGVSLNFDASALQASFGAQHGVDVPIEAMLEGGEDHGLLATFPAAVRLPEGFHLIGWVGEARPDPELFLDGSPYQPRGWDPFAPIAINRRG